VRVGHALVARLVGSAAPRLRAADLLHVERVDATRRMTFDERLQ